MTNIPNFAASHSRAKAYTTIHQEMMAKGRQLDGLPSDGRQALPGITKFTEDSVDVFTNEDKQQVVLAQKLAGPKVDWNFVSEDVDSDVAVQNYRTIMKPNDFGVLEVIERVDSRNSEGEVVDTWQREVETDPFSGGFSIHMVDR